MPTTHHTLLTLDARHPRTREAIIDAHSMHTLVMSGFTGRLPAGTPSVRERLGVLFAVQHATDQTIKIMVRSAVEAHFPEGGPVTSCVRWTTSNPGIGQRLWFRLCASPTRSHPPTKRSDGTLARGHKRPLLSYDEQLDWFTGRAHSCGFTPDRVTLSEEPALTSQIKSLPPAQRRTPRSTFRLNRVVFEGQLTVADADRFASALRDGIGPGKAYGCGLLLTVPHG